MKGKDRSALARLISAILSVPSLFYGFAVKLIDISYRTGLRKAVKCPIPVISVGNITVGGTGKTPFAIFLADYFSSLGKKTAVLARGYGNDEHILLRENLPGSLVFVGRDRRKSAAEAVEKGAEIIILDDGFQHRTVARDLDIVLIDAAMPFGGWHLLPRGFLRENVSSLARADLAVLTKCDAVSGREITEIKERIARIAPSLPVAGSRHEVFSLSDAGGFPRPLEDIKAMPVCVACAIADPDYFVRAVKGAGAEVVKALFYADHHHFTQSDADRIARAARLAGAERIIITEKDHVKMRKLDPVGIKEKLLILRVRIKITEGEEKLSAGLRSVISDQVR